MQKDSDMPQTIENWFKNHKNVAAGASKKTFMTFKPRIRNPGASDMWYSENKEFVKQYAEDNDRVGIDKFSTVKAQLFSELPETEQKIWEARATALKDSNEAALEDGASGDAIYRYDCKYHFVYDSNIDFNLVTNFMRIKTSVRSFQVLLAMVRTS